MSQINLGISLVCSECREDLTCRIEDEYHQLTRQETRIVVEPCRVCFNDRVSDVLICSECKVPLACQTDTKDEFLRVELCEVCHPREEEGEST